MKINNSFILIQLKTAKSRYFFPSRLFTFHSLVQLLLPTIQFNGVSQLVSIEYTLFILVMCIPFLRISGSRDSAKDISGKMSLR